MRPSRNWRHTITPTSSFSPSLRCTLPTRCRTARPCCRIAKPSRRCLRTPIRVPTPRTLPIRPPWWRRRAWRRTTALWSSSTPATFRCSGSGCPSDGHFQYNVEIVFDNTGELVARYYKSHVFIHKCFDQPTVPDVVYFNASFGVSFGLFVCYDILHSTPADELEKLGLRNFPYSVALEIVGEPVFRAWSETHAGNLIVSNNGGTCGFFNGGKMLPSKTYTNAAGSVMVATLSG